MATHTGNDGVVKIGANQVAEVRSFTLNQTADTVEDTTMGDTARTFKPTLSSADISLEVYWDETDTTGQVALGVRSEVTLDLYPEGDDSGDTKYSVPAIVTGFSINTSFDGMVEASITAQATGAITTSTV